VLWLAFAGQQTHRHCEERKRRSNPHLLCGEMDCFAEPVIGRIRATRWLAMTILVRNASLTMRIAIAAERFKTAIL